MQKIITVAEWNFLHPKLKFKTPNGFIRDTGFVLLDEIGSGATWFPNRQEAVRVVLAFRTPLVFDNPAGTNEGIINS